jgi:hypothetical protein
VHGSAIVGLQCCGWLYDPLLISALPAMRWAIFVKVVFSSRNVGLIVGAAGLAVLGYLAFLSRVLHLPGLPGSIDPLLFSGVPARELNGAALACAWLAVPLLVVAGLQRRARRVVLNTVPH